MLLGCFAEPVLGLAEGKTRGLAMTKRSREFHNHRVDGE
jgi:hypothetical protein